MPLNFLNNGYFAGKVGIGTASPERLLSLYSNDTETTPRLLIEQDGTGDAVMAFSLVGGQGWSMGIDNSGGDSFMIHNSAGGVDSSSQFTIKDNGNVGIGTTSPDDKLHVSVGAIRLDNFYQLRWAGTGTGIYGHSSQGLNFFTDAGSTRLKIENDGNVGIGTTSPGATFVVQPSTTSFNLGGLANGQIALGNNTNGGQAPTIGAKVTGNGQSALQFVTGQPNASTVAGMLFSIREDNNSDFATTANKIGYQFSRFTTALMTIMRDGNVGIGTTNPQSKLHLATTGASTLTIQNTTNSGNAALNFRDEGNNDQFQIYYALGANRSYNLVNGNGLTIYSSQSSSEIARFGNASSGYTDSYFTGNVGIGTTSPGAKLEIYGTDGSRTHFNEGLRVTRETVPTQYGMFNYNGGALNMIAVNTAGTGSVTKFMRSGNGTSLDTSMVIDTNGNVGIGTTDPQNPLHVNGSLRIGPFLTPDRDGFVFTPGGVLNTIQANNENTNFDNNQGNIHIRTINNSSATPVERITVLSTGNVGIGTSTPNAKLDVQGTQGQLFSVTDDLSGEIFAVADISGVPIMTVNSDGTSYFDGDVGIGTTSPDLQLHIKNTATGSTGIAIENTNNGQNLDIDFYSNAGSAQGRIRYEEGAGAFNISPNLGSPGAMYINWSNNVGIGTTTIDASAPKLQVSGSIMSSSSSLIAAPTAPSIVIDYHAASNAGRIMTGSATLWDKDLALVPYGGNVGIGTTSPSAALHVYDSSSGEVIFERVTGYSGLLHFGFPSGLPSIRTSGNFAIKASNTWGADFYINSSGNVGIGTTTPTSHKLDVDGSIRGTQYNLNGNVANPTSTTATIYDQASVGLTLSAHNLSIRNYDGTNMMESARFVHDKLTCAGDVIGYGSPSDIRLKENIKPIKSALDKAMQLQGVTFDWKKSDSILDIKEDIGFIAQDVQEVLPELVRENSDGMLSMRHQGITPILLEAIKELKAEIEDLKKKIK